MNKEKKIKMYKSLSLLLSTLIFPLQYLNILLFVFPAIYVGLIVPYLIWKTLFNGQFNEVKLFSLIWKIPLLLLLAISQFNMELIAFFTIMWGNFSDFSFLNILCLGSVFLIGIVFIRFISYALMIYVWQLKFVKFSTIAGCLIIFLYGLLNVYLTFMGIYVGEGFSSVDMINTEIGK